MSISPDQRDDWQRLRVALARWRQAEDRLYPLAAVDPESYLHAVGLVGVVADELRQRCATPGELLAADAAPAELLSAIYGDELPALALDPAMAVDAACALRAGELLAESRRVRHDDAIAAARAAGAPWVSLEGSRTATETTGQRCVEQHVRTGRTLLALADPYSGAEPFILEEIAPPECVRRCTFSDRDPWLAQWRRWREEIDEA